MSTELRKSQLIRLLRSIQKATDLINKAMSYRLPLMFCLFMTLNVI